MKVFLDYEIGDSGKGKFLTRLIPALYDLGVKVDDKPKHADVMLGISRWKSKIRLPSVLRVDGIHLDDENKRNAWVNNLIRQSIERSDSVIFQSQFSKRMVIEKLTNKIKKSYVVFNGANPKDYEVEPINTGYPKTVIAVAKWCNRHGLREQKGLKETVALFKELASRTTDTAYLILGAVPENYKTEGPIKFLGKVDESTLRRYLRSASEMYYLASMDWCPNAVVEAIVAGVKVHCNEVCESVKELLSVKPEELYIENIAKQYKQVLEETINGHK